MIVSLVLVALTFLGSRLIQSPETTPTNTVVPTQKWALSADQSLVEVEIFFSEKPLKYMLRRPGENEIILKNEALITNPALHQYTLRDASDTALWLDVTWPDDSIGKRNFVQVIITADGHESETFTFHDVTKVLKATIEISSPHNS